MKTSKNLLVACLFSWSGLLAAQAQTTAFTYQGRLVDNGEPANGTYEFQFTLFGELSGGSPLAGPVSPVPTPTPVTNGLFTVTLDFSSAPFMGANRWLEVDVRTNGSPDPFTTLAPRPQILPVPYAIYAHKAGTASVATVVGPNAVSPSGLQNDSVNSMKIADGTIMAGDLSSNLLNDTFWKLLGNGDTLPGTHFLGTTDNRPLHFRVNNLRVMRLEDPGDSSDPDTEPDGAPNVIAGSPANFADTNVVGATIAGGGATNNLQLDLGGFYVVGGNQVSSDFGTIGGGGNNQILGGSTFATIGGGARNLVEQDARNSTIGGGLFNTIQSNAPFATIAGGFLNSAEGPGAFIGGGGYDGVTFFAANSAAGSVSVIVGGVGNTTGLNTDYSAICGGYFNSIATGSTGAVIAGGAGNVVGRSAPYSAIGGGLTNSIGTNSQEATIAGGALNRIGTNSYQSTIGGGTENRIGFLAPWAAIAGGRFNNIAARSTNAAIPGGSFNDIGTNSGWSAIGGGLGNAMAAGSFAATIGGGYNNRLLTNSQYAIIPGGDSNTATNRAFAAGRRARANHAGAFVWADASNSDFPSTATNEFNVRATGGARIITAIDGAGAPTAGVSLIAGDTSWNVISDRAAKKNFQPADGREILEKLAALPITRWHYQWEETNATPHLGPVAQDFKAAFYPGRDDKTISTLEADGVALAAIQGLNSKLEEKLQQKESEITELKQAVAALKQLVETLAAERR